MYILDTDHLGIIQRRNEPEFSRLTSRMQRFQIDSFYATIVSFQEQAAGWNVYVHRARDIAGLVKGYTMLQSVLRDFTRANVLPFDTESAVRFYSFRKSGVRVGTMDLRIGSIALVHGYTVLTRNIVDFSRIPGLQVEDWTGPGRPR